MAIQLPDVGTGVPANKTGDSPWLAMKKVRENFSDQTNAASRLVGKGTANVPENHASFGVGGCGYGGRIAFLNNIDLDIVQSDTGFAIGDSAGLPCGFYYSQSGLAAESRLGRSFFINVNYSSNTGWRLGAPTTGKDLYFQWGNTSEWSETVKIYHTGNTTKDANGFLKAASPIVKVFADKVVLNDDAESQNITYKKNGVGDYTITTVSGLSTDGWYIELPKDMNGNPKVAVTLKETNGVITLKTYKRMFSMETFTFEPDLDNPLDVPDGRWIDLRLNEIPVEIEDDVQTEV